MYVYVYSGHVYVIVYVCIVDMYLCMYICVERTDVYACVWWTGVCVWLTGVYVYVCIEWMCVYV